jgi:hypothetical protein
MLTGNDLIYYKGWNSPVTFKKYEYSFIFRNTDVIAHLFVDVLA